MVFPKVSGQNLEFKNITIPSDLEGNVNLVIIPFKQWQQNLVNEWSFYLNLLESEILKFRYYEVPTLSYGYKVMRFVIDGGMRAGIPDRSVRARTITLYLDKSKLKKLLKIPSEDTIYLFLITKEGNIIWRGQGEYTQEKANELRNTLLTNI